jgi:hypothetical protein
LNFMRKAKISMQQKPFCEVQVHPLANVFDMLS